MLSAAVVGALAERRWDRSVRSSIGEMFLGEVVLYAVAIPWLMQSLDVSLARALELGLAPFVVGTRSSCWRRPGFCRSPGGPFAARPDQRR